MDESAVAQALVIEISEIARMQQCNKVLSARVRLGAGTGISSDYLRQHFITLAQGTVAEDARLEIEVRQDADEPRSSEVVLEDVEVVC
jgi:Zn finger protein HypA/HybF involved in hydrogenase expression